MRPSLSERLAQKKRPPMLNRLSSAAKPAATPAIAVSCVLSSSPKLLGDADQAAAEDFLQHRAGHADHADAGADVHAVSTIQTSQNCGMPQTFFTWTWRCVIMALAVRAGGRRPAGRLPAGGRDAVAEGAADHEDEVDAGHHDEGLHHADVGRRREVLHQLGRERRADHRAAAEAHDRHAGGHAAPVGKPLDQRAHRADVAQARGRCRRSRPSRGSSARTGAGGCRAPRSACRRTSTPPTPRRPCAGRPARASRPRARPRRPRKTKKSVYIQPSVEIFQSQLVTKSSWKKPTSGPHLMRSLMPSALRQRQPEHREAVGHADAQVDRQRRRRHQPAVEAGPAMIRSLSSNPVCMSVS